jgi:hypothetical protein
MMRRIAIAAVATFAAVPALAGTAAADSQNDCPRGNFCIWQDYGFNEHMKSWPGTDRSYENNSWPGTTDGLNNEASSVWNRKSCAVIVYQGYGHTGETETFTSDDEDGRLSNNEIGDNRMSSHEVTG